MVIPLNLKFYLRHKSSLAMFWTDDRSFSNKFVIESSLEKLEGIRLARTEWKMLNRFRWGHRCSASDMYRWNFQGSPFCDCGKFTLNHNVNECYTRCPLKQLVGYKIWI